MNQFNPYFPNGFIPYSNMLNGMSSFPLGQMGMNQMLPNTLMQGANAMQSASGLSALSKTFRGFNYSTFLDGTQKTLNTINQIIPLVNQVSPMIRNASTMFRVVGEVKKMNNDIPTPMNQPIIIDQEPQKTNIANTPISNMNPDHPTYF